MSERAKAVLAREITQWSFSTATWLILGVIAFYLMVGIH